MKKLLYLLVLAIVLAIAYQVSHVYIGQQISQRAQIASLSLSQHPQIKRLELSYERNNHQGILSYSITPDWDAITPLWVDLELDFDASKLEQILAPYLTGELNVDQGLWFSLDHGWQIAKLQQRLPIVVNDDLSLPFEHEMTVLLNSNLVYLAHLPSFEHHWPQTELAVSFASQAHRLQLQTNTLFNWVEGHLEMGALRIDTGEELPLAELGGMTFKIEAEQQRQGLWLQHADLVWAASQFNAEELNFAFSGLDMNSYLAFNDQEQKLLDSGFGLALHKLEVRMPDLDEPMAIELFSHDWLLENIKPEAVIAWERLAHEPSFWDDEEQINQALLAMLSPGLRVRVATRLEPTHGHSISHFLQLEQQDNMSDWQQWRQAIALETGLSFDPQGLDHILAWPLLQPLTMGLDAATVIAMFAEYLEFADPHYQLQLALNQQGLLVNEEANPELEFLLELALAGIATQSYGADFGDELYYEPFYAPEADAEALQADRPYRQSQLSLVSGFTPDPSQVSLLLDAISPVLDLPYECVGLVNPDGADVHLNYQAGGSELWIYAESMADTTLIVRDPDGQWHCDDDGLGFSLNPMLYFAEPASGLYQIWLGGYYETEAEASLFFSGYEPEMLMDDYDFGDYDDPFRRFGDDALPLQIDLPARQGEDKISGVLDSVIGRWLSVDAVTEQATAMDYSCVGRVNVEGPDYRIVVDAMTSPHLYLWAESELDTTLIVQGPGGQWFCDDDSYGQLNPGLLLPAQSGDYLVWVGAYETDRAAMVHLQYSSQRPGQGYWYEPPQPLVLQSPARQGSGQYFQLPDHQQVSISLQALIQQASNEHCVGYIDPNGPDYLLELSADADGSLYIWAESEVDTTLIVRSDDGQWHCNDDGFDTGVNPKLSLPATAGQYQIWVGGFSPEAGNAQLHYGRLAPQR